MSELEKMAAEVKLDDSAGRKHERRRKKSKDLLDTTSVHGMEVEHTDGADSFIKHDAEVGKCPRAFLMCVSNASAAV